MLHALRDVLSKFCDIQTILIKHNLKVVILLDDFDYAYVWIATSALLSSTRLPNDLVQTEVACI